MKPRKLSISKMDDDEYESEEGSYYDIQDVEEPVPSKPRAFTYSKELERTNKDFVFKLKD